MPYLQLLSIIKKILMISLASLLPGTYSLLGSSITPKDVGQLFSIVCFAGKEQFHHKNTEIDLKQLYVEMLHEQISGYLGIKGNTNWAETFFSQTIVKWRIVKE